MATEEKAKWKFKKDLPAPDKGVQEGPRRKVKKPWTFRAEWKEGVRFKSTKIQNGKVIEEKYLTLDEYIEDNEFLEEFYRTPWCFFPNYKTEAIAMQAWEAHKNNAFMAKRNKENVRYFLINKNTGEEKEVFLRVFS